MKVRVVFKTHYASYNPGEIAGFRAGLAGELVKAGIGEYADGPPAKEDEPVEEAAEEATPTERAALELLPLRDLRKLAKEAGIDSKGMSQEELIAALAPDDEGRPDEA